MLGRNFKGLLLLGMGALILVAAAGCRSTGEDLEGDGNTIPPAADSLGRPRGQGAVAETGDLAGFDEFGAISMLPESAWTAPGETLGGRGDGDWTPIPGLQFPTIYFAYDQDVIGASERPKLEQVAEYMLAHSSIGLIIEGHCDERGSEEYNRALGERRALSVKNYLAQLGLPDARMRTLSYGEERPAAQGSNEETYAKNRRAELVPARM